MVCLSNGIIQANGQMMCSGIDQSIISVWHKMVSHIYTLNRWNCVIHKAVLDFWERIDKEENYPDLMEESAKEFVDLSHLSTKPTRS